MYKLSVSAANVHSSLGKHILADGFDLVLDREQSHDYLFSNAAKQSAYLQQHPTTLSNKYHFVANVKGRELLTAFNFADQAIHNKFIKMGIQNTAAFVTCGVNTILFKAHFNYFKQH